MTDIANEGLDFAQFEAFIQDANGNVAQRMNQPLLPESPSESESEPPYSSNLQNLDSLRTNSNSRSRISNSLKHSTTNEVTMNSVVDLPLPQNGINTSDTMFIDDDNEIETNVHKEASLLKSRGSDCGNFNTINMQDNLLEPNKQRNFKDNFINSFEQDNNSNIVYVRSALATHQSVDTKKRKLTHLSLSTESISLTKQEFSKNSNSKYISENLDVIPRHDQQLLFHQHTIQNSNTLSSPTVCLHTIDSESLNPKFTDVSNLHSDAIMNSLDSSSSNENSDANSMQSIRFNLYEPNTWHTLCDQNHREL